MRPTVFFLANAILGVHLKLCLTIRLTDEQNKHTDKQTNKQKLIAEEIFLKSAKALMKTFT